MLSYIPQHILDKAYAEYGETLEGAAEAVWQFNKEIVDKTYDLIPAVKPQIAMYEQLGIPGLEAFKKTVDYCKSKDLVIIGDVKRGDIGSTSAAYATGHLGKIKVGSKEYVPFGEDFATVNPYLGSDGVNPFIDVCKEEKKGLFILVKTSNPSSGEFQDRSAKLFFRFVDILMDIAFAGANHRLDFSGIQTVDDVLSGQQIGGRNGDGADFVQCHSAYPVFPAAAQDEHNHCAFPDAQALKIVCGLVRQTGDVRKGERLFLAVVIAPHQRFLFRFLFRPFVHNVKAEVKVIGNVYTIVLFEVLVAVKLDAW